MQVHTYVRTYVDWQTNVLEYTDDGAESLAIVCEGGQTGASTSDMGATCHKLIKQQSVASNCCTCLYNLLPGSFETKCPL